MDCGLLDISTQFVSTVRYVYISKNIFHGIIRGFYSMLYTDFMQNISIFHGTTARCDVLEIKFVDISRHKYKLPVHRDIE